MNRSPREQGRAGMTNAMTVDVEDYFQVQAFANVFPRSKWADIPRRVEANVDRILQLFADTGVSATFFTLGWIAERHGGMVRRIVAAGHELASHGYFHQRADEQDRATFTEDVTRAMAILEDIGGVQVRGYRAPTFSIGPRNPWAFDALAEAGYSYSSSVFPIRHDLYGMPDAPRAPYRPGASSLIEIPMTTVRVAGRNLPCAGGGYFRLMPYALFRFGLRRVHHAEQRSGVFYFHPWEIDPGQPRVAEAPPLSRFRHGVNIARMEGRLTRLLRDFQWDRMDRVFAGDLSAPACAPSRPASNPTPRLVTLDA
jgi:polysaccharide deacetylase family protein (PEP-CTERM system associated)